jgi:hypothetical protein
VQGQKLGGGAGSPICLDPKAFVPVRVLSLVGSVITGPLVGSLELFR